MTAAPETPGLIAEPGCARGCWWIACMFTPGLDRNGLRWGHELIPEIARLAPDAVIGFQLGQERGRLDLIHPNAETPRRVVGVIEDSWTVERSVLIRVHLLHTPPAARRLRSALCAMERDGILHRAGVSLHAMTRQFEGASGEAVVAQVTRLVAVDVVLSPAIDGARVLRAWIPSNEDSSPDRSSRRAGSRPHTAEEETHHACGSYDGR